MTGETTVRSARAPRTDNATRPGLPVGTSVGRYVVLAVAGQGASGVVYRAYDPELDRNVALKVLDTPVGEDPGLRRLMLSEARALAKVRHPNIVAVYDVGEHEGRGFVAMEYVAGTDLRGWLQAQSRSWTDIAGVMARAARGLAAAHDAGIVHRDFKPSNVLVDAGGAVCVADFGLARAVRHEEGAKSVDTDASEPSMPPGTPPYIAPELYDGDDPGPRSDVFAFCVTLWEVAYGQLPWSHDDEAILLELKRAGVPTPLDRGAVPREIATLLRAGLQADASARPASPTVLADALQRDRGPRRWGLLALVGLAAVAATASVLRDSDPCADAARSLDPVWGDAARASLEAAVRRSTVANPGETWTRLDEGTQAWAQRWRAERVDACQATHLRHEQSPALLDRRVACLDRELSQLRRLHELIAAGDRDVVAQGPRAVVKLAVGLSCDRASIAARDEDPTGPEAEAIVADLDHAQVLEMVAQYDAGLALSREVQTRAEALGAEGLRLRAKYRRGRLLDLTGATTEAAAIHQSVHWDAEAGGYAEVAASAGLDVMYVYGAVLGKPDVALSWAPHVDAAIRRAGDNPRQRASFLDATGVAHLNAHDVAAALEAHEAALGIRESYDEQGLDTVVTLQNLGIACEELHRYDEAIDHQERALEILGRILGEHHPHTARVMDNLGTALLRKGDIAAAREHFQRALAIRRTVLGPTHRSVALSTMHLAHAALSAGDPALAIASFEDARAIYAEVGQPGARELLLCDEGLAHAHAAAGNAAQATRYAQAALAGLATTLPADHPEIVGLRALLDSAGAP